MKTTKPIEIITTFGELPIGYPFMFANSIFIKTPKTYDKDNTLIGNALRIKDTSIDSLKENYTTFTDYREIISIINPTISF